MELYEFLLFLHIAGAVIWVGGALMMQLFSLRFLREDDPNRLAEFAADTERLGNRALLPAALLTVLAGFGLVWESEFWTLGDDWIVIGLVLFAITFLTGALFLGPEGGRVRKLIQAEGAVAAEPRIKRLIVLSRIDLITLFLLIFDMTVKPSFDDIWTIVGAVAAAALLAALVIAPTTRARPAL